MKQRQQQCVDRLHCARRNLYSACLRKLWCQNLIFTASWRQINGIHTNCRCFRHWASVTLSTEFEGRDPWNDHLRSHSHRLWTLPLKPSGSHGVAVCLATSRASCHCMQWHLNITPFSWTDRNFYWATSMWLVDITCAYCHILGFPGNATMKQTCPHNNETDASIQQCKQAVIEFHNNETVDYGLRLI
jgi:hypothetical protein